ncbi:hypothetical protein EC968_008835 [Mortierella alpina]|nr:hypothetical protein EC968_008835 [Mortierella alpina]
MSHSAPTDAQLLDMAREVLAVCQDRSLRDIIEDLSITHSSEQTINRIFDGQFLKALVAEAIAAPSQDVVILLSSSEDDASDQESLPGPRETASHIGNSVSKGFDRPSPPLPSAMSATRASLFVDDSEMSKGQHTLKIEQRQPNVDDDEKKEAPSGNRSLFQVSTDEQPLRNRSMQSEEPLVRPRPTATTFRIASPVDNDAFPDWDYDLIPSPARGSHGAPTIIFSPPSKHSQNIQRTSEIRDNSSRGTSILASPPPGTPPRTTASPESSDERSIESIISRADIRPSSHVSSSRSSCERSLSPRDFEPQTYIDLDDGPDLEWSSSHWKNDIVASDVEDRDYLDKKARWDAIANASLSPPTLLQDYLDESDQELYDDVFSGLPTGRKKGLSRSSSKPLVPGRRRAQGKARALSASPELDDWSGETPSRGSLSVEQEIESRNRRKRARQQDVASGDSDSVDESSTSTQRRRSSKEPHSEEAKKLAKEEQQRAKDKKKADREWERERKQAIKERQKWDREEDKRRQKREKEEEREAERNANRELRIANRLTTKSESAKEMIVCIEESLHQSPFGQIMQDYLSSIECQVNVLRVAGSVGASTSQEGQSGRFNKGQTDELCPARNTLFWRRTVTARYDREKDVFFPTGTKEIQLESFLLLYQTAEDFVQALEQKRFLGLLSQLKRDLRLRKNKERLASIGNSESTATSQKEDPRQRQRIILLITGMEGYFRGLRKVMTTRHRQMIRERMFSGDVEGRSPTSTTQKESPAVNRTFIEQELLRLQLEHDCLIIHSCDEEDSAQVIASLTEQIGLKPYIGTRKTELNIHTEGVRSGTDPEDTWIKTLQAIHMVTNVVARSIVTEYPTIKSLYDGYRQCASTAEAQSMLEGIPKQPSDKDNTAADAGSDGALSAEAIRNLPLSPYGGRFGVPDQPKSSKSIALAQANSKRSPFSKAKDGMKSKVHDWTDKDKNLEKRKELLTDFQSGYFAEFSELSRSGSKLWKATAGMVNADKALYMPNIIGTSLKTSEPVELVDILKGKISLIAISGTRFGEEQIETFMTPFLKQWPMGVRDTKVQLVELNIQENPLKAGLVRMMVPFVKKTIPENRHANYILHYKSIKHLRDPLSMQNSYLGYVFLVDSNCKIRWGAHGAGTEEEIKTLLDSVQRLSERGGRGTAEARHTLELYLDYVCPFSAKLWDQVYHNVLPWLEKEHPGQVQIILRNQIQPWHPSSTLTAEAALAVEKVDPSVFAPYSDALFKQQKSFFDEAVVEKSRNEQYKALALLAASIRTTMSPLIEEIVYDQLHIYPVQDSNRSTNTGNKVSNDLKYFIKIGRQNGIHVSPTALWDGVVENAISSGWSLDSWKEFLQSKW